MKELKPYSRILAKHRAGLYEVEGDIVLFALLIEQLYPLISARAAAVIVFAAAKHLLNLSFCKITVNIYRANQRRSHNSLVLEWK